MRGVKWKYCGVEIEGRLLKKHQGKFEVSPIESEDFGIMANSFEIEIGSDIDSGDHRGLTPYQVDTNNLLIQTGTLGLLYINASGVAVVIDTEDWYYKIFGKRNVIL